MIVRSLDAVYPMEMESSNSAGVDYMDSGSNNDAAADDNGPRKKIKVEVPRPMCTNCEQCQLRKGKCDGGRPVCGWCAANNKPCVYQEKKKPGLKAGYGRDLERRLTNLEDTLTEREDDLERRVHELEEQIRGHSQLLDQLSQARSIKSLPSHVASPAAGHTSAGAGGGGSPVPSGHPAHVNASMATHSPFAQNNAVAFSSFASPAASSHPSIVHGELLPHRSSIASHTAFNGTPSSQPRSTYAGPNQAAQNQHGLADPDLPPFDLAYDLVDLYFNRINPWFPLLDRKWTVNKILRSNAEEDMILLHAIIATTIRFYDKTETKGLHRPEYEARRHEWHATSKKKVIFHSFETPSIRRLQALAILAVDMIGEQQGGPGMFILASIARCATQLGLMTETFSLTTSPDYPTISTLRATVLPDPEDFLEDEARRRLFWLIYMLDRDTTVATAFDFVLDENNIDRKLPCKDELYSANQPVDTRWFETSQRRENAVDHPQNLGAFSYLIELKSLMTKIHQFLKKPVNTHVRADVDQWRQTYREIDNKLRTWRAGLPYDLRNTDQVLSLVDGQPMSCSWVLLQITYYTVFIRMHSSAAYPPHKTNLFKPSVAAAHQCFQAAERILALTRYVISHDMLKQQGPPFAFSLWVGARVLLVHGSTVEKQVSGEIYFLIQTLQKIGEYWPVAARYGQVLQRVMNECSDSQATLAAAAATGSITSQPPSVTILADMRRCAYDLDMLISNEPLRQSGSAFMGGWQAPAYKANPNPAPLPNELDYIETFNFFNYPRMPLAMPNNDAAGFNNYYSPSDGTSQASMNNFTMQDLNSDWLSTHFS